MAPQGADWEQAVAYWRTLPSDPGAKYDTEVTVDAAHIAPQVPPPPPRPAPPAGTLPKTSYTMLEGGERG